jgi:hypothetical protein
MTVPFVRRSNGINYIRFVNGIPYVYTGASGNLPIFQYTVCQTGAITSDYAITFIDEAHPLYVIGSGEIGGMWGPDVYYYNEHIDPNFPSCAHILFDVDTPFVARGSYKGQSITEDPFYVYPTGVDTNSPVGCELPMPELNIVQIPRPSGGTEFDGIKTAVGSISQTTFKDNIIAGIETVWGTGFWDRMASSSNQLWIIRESGLSMGVNVIQSGIDLFKEYLFSEKNIDYTEHFPSCGDTDRYLGWLTDAISYSGEDVSCTGVFPLTDITAGNIQGSGTSATGKLVTMTLENYGSTEGIAGSYNVVIDEILDDTTDWSDIPEVSGTKWPPLEDGKYTVGSYSESDQEAGGIEMYNYTVKLYNENGLLKAEVIATCYDNGALANPPLFTTWTWQSIVPVDKNGIPSGILELSEILSKSNEDGLCTGVMSCVDYDASPEGGGACENFIELLENETCDDCYTDGTNVGSLEGLCPDMGTCVPRFPIIEFTSYVPTTFPSPPGTDCTIFNA